MYKLTHALGILTSLCIYKIENLSILHIRKPVIVSDGIFVLKFDRHTYNTALLTKRKGQEEVKTVRRWDLIGHRLY